VPQPQQQQQQLGLRLNFPQFKQGKNNNHCFNCDSSSHFIKNCPQPRKSFQGQTSNPSSKGRDKKQTVQVRQGRVNFTTLFELLEGAPIMTGTFTIHHQPAFILFDSSATHSFISPKFGTKVGLDFYHTKGTYMIATPGGKIASNQVRRDVPIQLGSTKSSWISRWKRRGWRSKDMAVAVLGGGSDRKEAKEEEMPSAKK
jgi:hypothetical protein